MNKVLFIAPQFYGFERHIEEAIKALGFDVDYFNEKPMPDNSVLFRILAKAPKYIFQKFIESYYKKMLRKEYDYVFIIRGELVSSRILKWLKEKNSDAVFIMYQWDFKRNLPLLAEQIKFFDKLYTFDKVDAHDLAAEFKALFYIDTYNTNLEEIQYDVCFIGAHHSDRYEFLRKFIRVNNLDEDKCYFYLYRTRMSYLYRKYILRENIGTIAYRNIKYKMHDEKETLKIIRRSKAVLDIHSVNQNGLTMRTFEAIGQSKKLLTTNECIKYYDFYQEENIKVLDRENPIFDKSFIETDYKKPDENIIKKYAVSEWVKDFFI